jgi:hypothetical protein
MAPSTTITQLNELLNKAEAQGVAIIRRLAQPDDFAASFDGFRDYIDEIDQFYVLVDLVEEQLPKFEADRRDKLTHNLVNLRWQVCIVEVNATQVFILRIESGSRSLPLGSRDFLLRRRERLGEIADFYDRFNEKYALPKIQADLVEAVRALLDRSIVKAQSLTEFLADAMQESMVAQSGPALRSPSEFGMPIKRKPVEFRVRLVHGRYFADGLSLQAVAEACADSKMTMDDLARQLGISRSQLSLILNGADAMPSRIHDALRNFLRKS